MMLAAIFRVILCIVVVAFVAPSHARERRQLDPTPNAITPCSLLDEGPCTPSVCGLYDAWPCLPQVPYAFGQTLQLTVLSVPNDRDAEKYRRPDHDLNTLTDLFAALRACWSPPSARDAREGMQMSMRFSFKRDGAIIAAPRVTFASADAPTDLRDRYREAILASLQSCVPLTFTPALGNAIAGRPIAIRYVDNRKLGEQR